MSDEIKCPKCGSTQLAANKKGFSFKRMVLGGVIAPIGLLGGLTGMGRIVITCLKCGKKFKPGEGK